MLSGSAGNGKGLIANTVWQPTKRELHPNVGACPEQTMTRYSPKKAQIARDDTTKRMTDTKSGPRIT